MLNFPNLKGLQRPSSPSSVPAHMAQALAMVREGRLQEASALLMGHGKTAEDVGPETPSKPAPPSQRMSDWAARGLANVQDVLDKMDLPEGRYSAAPARAAASPTHPPRTSDSRTQAAPTRPAEPGRFECVAFMHNGVSHPYFLYTPQTAAPAGGRPLVMMLHGCTQDAQDFARGTCMNATAEAAGALVLYPTQSQSANANGCWNWFRPEDQKCGAGEPALLRAMLQHAMEAQPVDSQRVFVAGLSAGGAMAAVMAEQYPRVFAGVGVHSGLPPGAATSMLGALSAMKSGAKGWRASLSRGGERVVPMIVVHGDADKTVHKRNAEQLLQSVATGVATTVQTQDKGVSSDGQQYTRTCVLDPAAPGQVVAECWLLRGAGHAWSGGDARGSHTSAHGVNASAEMMRFFLAQAARGA